MTLFRMSNNRFDGKFFLLLEISIVTIHHREGCLVEAFNAAGSSKHELEHAGVFFLGHHGASHGKVIIQGNSAELI